MRNVKIDFGFIGALEGNKLEGYVPDPENSKSGVTIGCGFDLGQRSVGDLYNSFDSSLAIRLAQYAGKTGYDAAGFLSANPLVITDEECEIINQFAHKQATLLIINTFNSSKCLVNFEQLSTACQTVVASLSYQYGHLPSRCPKFWSYLQTLEWLKVIHELRNFNDGYSTRRNKEADLIEQWLRNGADYDS